MGVRTSEDSLEGRFDVGDSPGRCFNEQRVVPSCGDGGYLSTVPRSTPRTTKVGWPEIWQLSSRAWVRGNGLLKHGRWS